MKNPRRDSVERPKHAGPHQRIRNKFLSELFPQLKTVLSLTNKHFSMFLSFTCSLFQSSPSAVTTAVFHRLSLSSNSPSVVHQLFANFHPTICWLYSKGVPSSNVLTADVPYTPAVRHLSTSCSLGVRQLSINHSPASAQLLAASPSTE